MLCAHVLARRHRRTFRIVQTGLSLNENAGPAENRGVFARTSDARAPPERMPGNLSITPENGRGMRTYGAAGFASRNSMKIVLLCVVVRMSWCAKATEDFAAYPGECPCLRRGSPMKIGVCLGVFLTSFMSVEKSSIYSFCNKWLWVVLFQLNLIVVAT